MRMILGALGLVLATQNPGLKSAKAQDDERVSMDFPEMTDIKDISRAVALWTGVPTILDRNVSGKLQIHAPDKLTLEEAYQRYLAALDELGLVAVEHHGVRQIVPARAVKPEVEARREALTVPPLIGSGIATVDYPEPTEIKTVIADVAKWSGRRMVLDRNVNGKVQILSAKAVSLPEAYRIYLTALDQLGLTEVDRGGVVQIMPIVTAKHVRELRTVAPPADPEGTATIDFPAVTDIGSVLEAARPWYGRDLIVSRDVNGKVQILAPGPLPKSDAFKILVAALDELGLTMEPEGGAVRIVPYRALSR